MQKDHFNHSSKNQYQYAFEDIHINRYTQIVSNYVVIVYKISKIFNSAPK